VPVAHVGVAEQSEVYAWFGGRLHLLNRLERRVRVDQFPGGVDGCVRVAGGAHHQVNGESAIGSRYADVVAGVAGGPAGWNLNGEAALGVHVLAGLGVFRRSGPPGGRSSCAREAERELLSALYERAG